MDAAPKWAAISAATDWKPADARTFLAPGTGQCERLEAWLEIAFRKLWRPATGPAPGPPWSVTMESGFSRPAVSGHRQPHAAYVCGHPGCDSDFYREDAVSPQAPPAMKCFVCGQRGCHSSCHEGNNGPPPPSAPNQPVNPAPGPTMGTISTPSNWQRGLQKGERSPPANVPPRPQTN